MGETLRSSRYPGRRSGRPFVRRLLSLTGGDRGPLSPGPLLPANQGLTYSLVQESSTATELRPQGLFGEHLQEDGPGAQGPQRPGDTACSARVRQRPPSQLTSNVDASPSLSPGNLRHGVRAPILAPRSLGSYEKGSSSSTIQPTFLAPSGSLHGEASWASPRQLRRLRVSRARSSGLQASCCPVCRPCDPPGGSSSEKTLQRLLHLQG